MKWIKTSEQLPKINQSILAWFDGTYSKHPDIMTWDGCNWIGLDHMGDFCTHDRDRVSHWSEITTPE